MRTLLLCAAAIPAATLTAAPAEAVVTVLDFNGNICGAAGNQACGNTAQIGQNYGDSALADVSYRSINTTTNVTAQAFLTYWASNYGDLTNIVYGGSDATNFASEITFTAAAGQELSLLSFDAACYVGRTSCLTLNYTLTDLAGNSIGGGSTSTLYPGHVAVSPATAYLSGVILRWGPDGYDVGLDNIRFDVRAIAGPVDPGAVPEPATWAMMIGGFGLVGGAMRRRQGARVLA